MDELTIRQRQKRLFEEKELQKKTFYAIDDIRIGSMKIKSGQTVKILAKGIEPTTGFDTYNISDDRGRKFSVQQSEFPKLFSEKQKVTIKPKPQKPKPLPADALNVSMLKFNSDEFMCYGVDRKGYRVYCRRKS